MTLMQVGVAGRITGGVAKGADYVLGNTVGRALKGVQSRALGALPDEATGGSFASEDETCVHPSPLVFTS